MAKTAKRLAGPVQVPAAVGTRYTVPAGTKTILRHIHIFNPSGATVKVTLTIGADAAGTRIYDAVSILAGAELDRWCYYVLEAAEIVQSSSDTNNTAVLILDGDELTLG